MCAQRACPRSQPPSRAAVVTCRREVIRDLQGNPDAEKKGELHEE